IVINSGSGYYTVGNVYSEFDTNIASAGWILVVVYTSPYLGFVNVNINIGNLDIGGDGSVSTTLSGFETSPAGSQVQAQIVLTALNGNPASAGDQVSLTNSSNEETYLYGPHNPVDNFFGSQIIELDGNICDKGTFGNLNTTPASIQSTVGRRIGYDVAIVDAAPALSNSQTSTVLTGSTTGNNYSITSAILLLTDAYPFFSINVESSDTSILLGQKYTLTYTLENTGSISTDSLYLTFDDTGLVFDSGSYTISGSTTAITQNPNNLLLPNVTPNTTINISLTYIATEIPDILYYDNLGTFYYTFMLAGQDTYENTVSYGKNVDIIYSDILDVTNTNSVSTIAPLINPTATDISYTIVSQPSKGSVNLSQTTIAYTPSTLQQTTDQFVIRVINSSNNKSINLIYNINQVVVPMINVIVNNGTSVDLYSTVMSTITLQNLSSYPITNIHTSPSLAPGFVIPEAQIVSTPVHTDIVRIANNFTIGNLDGNSSITWSFTYQAVMLPTDLIYLIGGSLSFTFGGIYFESSGGSNPEPQNIILPIANLDATVSKNQEYSVQIPVLEYHYPPLSYSITSQSSFGNATVNSSGMLTYTPNNNFVGTDNVTVTITNSQADLDTTLDVNYTFTVVDPINPPCPNDIPDKLVQLLNYDVYLMALQDLTLSENVCFDCELWTNGYSDSSAIVIIPPISTSLIAILTQLSNKLVNVLNDNSLNAQCSQASFKSQVERLLAIINDLKSKISLIQCNNNTCNESLFSSLLSLLSNTLDILITVSSTLNGLLGICTNNCSVCDSSFSNLMSIFINSTTLLYNLLLSWSNITMAFMNLSVNSSSSKSYVPMYVPNRPITQPTKSYSSNCFICPPRL
ncbi:MAG: Ig-like domain-containing protein, partial [Peptostreptococcaceae bacterium]